MATAVHKITLSSSRDIPFNKLVLSQSNVRRVKAGVSIEELAEDIARRTLLQSLNVRPVLDTEGAETGMFEIPAGGRRYRALELLVKQKRLAKTAPVPCVVRDPATDILAEDDSLAKNIQRAPLHPLDQFRAFLRLREKGLSEEDIAAAYFISVNLVKQRLRLASVAQALLDVYAEDGMSLEQLMAFTVCPDHARQKQVWAALEKSWSKEPYQIRRMLTEKTARASDKRATFVGLDAYEAAGGVVLRDLFQQDDSGWLENVALLDSLVAEKLKAEAVRIAAEGWKWIEVATEFPYGHARGLHRLDGTAAELTAEERAAIDALKAEYADLEAQHEGADEVPDAVDERLGEIETALTAFEKRSVSYSPAEITRAGVFISIGSDGALSLDRGYVLPEDEAPTIDPDQASKGEAETTGEDGVEPTPPTVQRAVFTIGGQAAEPEEEVDDAVKRPSSARGCLEVSVRHVSFNVQAVDLKDSPSARAIAERHDTWKNDIPQDDHALWDWLAALDDASRLALLAHCVSNSVNALYESVIASTPSTRRPTATAPRASRSTGSSIVSLRPIGSPAPWVSTWSRPAGGPQWTIISAASRSAASSRRGARRRASHRRSS